LVPVEEGIKKCTDGADRRWRGEEEDAGRRAAVGAKRQQARSAFNSEAYLTRHHTRASAKQRSSPFWLSLTAY
jgi:hypothetical protein